MVGKILHTKSGNKVERKLGFPNSVIRNITELLNF